MLQCSRRRSKPRISCLWIPAAWDSTWLVMAQAFEFRFRVAPGGSTCLLWADPKTGQGAVIMTNSASASGAIRLEILVGIASEYGWPLLH